MQGTISQWGIEPTKLRHSARHNSKNQCHTQMIIKV